MYILISKNDFDGTKRYEYATLEEAIRGYEATKMMIDMPGPSPSYDLTLYKDSVKSKNVIKRHIKKAVKR